jgi:hypothetical protein
MDVEVAEVVGRQRHGTRFYPRDRSYG